MPKKGGKLRIQKEKFKNSKFKIASETKSDQCTWTRKEIDLKSIRLSHDSYFMHENLGSRSGSSRLVGFECWPVYGCGKVSVAVARMMMSGHTGS